MPPSYATLVIALAVVPLFFLEGLAGAFFPDIATAYLVALLASMVVALTLTPALNALLLSRGHRRQRRVSPRADGCRIATGRVLRAIVRRPTLAYGVIGAVVVAGALSVPFLGNSLLPTFKESELRIRWNGPPGTSLPEMSRITALAGRELRSIPGVRDVGAHVGRAITGDQVVGVNAGGALGQHRSRRRLRRDGGRREEHGGRLPRALPQRRDLLERTRHARC